MDKSSNIRVFVSPSGWVEVHDPFEQETHVQNFYNLKNVIQSEGFLLIELYSGRIETYDLRLNLLGYKVFEDLKSVSVNGTVEIDLNDGSHFSFDKYLKPFSRN